MLRQTGVQYTDLLAVSLQSPVFSLPEQEFAQESINHSLLNSALICGIAGGEQTTRRPISEVTENRENQQLSGLFCH